MQKKVTENKNAQLIVAILILVVYFFIFVAPYMASNENSSFKGSAAHYYSATIIPYVIFLVYFIYISQYIRYIRCILFPICAFILYFGLTFVIPGGGAAAWLLVFTLLPFLIILLIIFAISLGYDILDKNKKSGYIQRPRTKPNAASIKQLQQEWKTGYIRPMEFSVDSKICPFCGEEIPKGYRSCPRGCDSLRQDILSHINPINLEDELKGFNWGAFFLSWIWGIGNGVPAAMYGLILGVASLVPGVFILTLPYFIWLGGNGNKLAWASGKHTNIKTFKAEQQKWAIYGWIFVIVFLSIIVPCMNAPKRPF